MKLNIPNRQRALVIGAGALVALYVLDTILIEPLTKTWQAHTLEIAQLQKSVAEGHGTITRAAQIRRV